MSVCRERGSEGGFGKKVKEGDGTKMMRRPWKEFRWEREADVSQCLERETEHVKERIINVE